MSIRTCRGCNKTEEYDADKGWMWYGSLADWEDDQDRCHFTCSDRCRTKLVGESWKEMKVREYSVSR